MLVCTWGRPSQRSPRGAGELRLLQFAKLRRHTRGSGDQRDRPGYQEFAKIRETDQEIRVRDQEIRAKLNKGLDQSGKIST